MKPIFRFHIQKESKKVETGFQTKTPDFLT